MELNLGFKGLNISVCILALDIRRAKRMHHIILPSVACKGLCIFPHYFINGTIFE